MTSTASDEIIHEFFPTIRPPQTYCYEHISFDWSLMEPLDYLTNNRYPIEAVVSFSIRHIYVPVFC